MPPGVDAEPERRRGAAGGCGGGGRSKWSCRHPRSDSCERHALAHALATALGWDGRGAKRAGGGKWQGCAAGNSCRKQPAVHAARTHTASEGGLRARRPRPSPFHGRGWRSGGRLGRPGQWGVALQRGGGGARTRGVGARRGREPGWLVALPGHCPASQCPLSPHHPHAARGSAADAAQGRSGPDERRRCRGACAGPLAPSQLGHAAQ